MKLGTQTKGVLSKNNLDLVKAERDLTLESTSFECLLLALGEMFDEIANGADMYCIIGATSNKSSFVLTVKHNGAPTSVYGGSITELGLKTADLL